MFIHLLIHLYHILFYLFICFIHGYLSYVYVFAIVTVAAMNAGVQITLWDSDITQSEISGSFLIFLRTPNTAFCSDWTNWHSHQQWTRAPFMLHLHHHLLFSLAFFFFYNSHSNKFQIPCDFDLIQQVKKYITISKNPLGRMHILWCHIYMASM